MQIFICTLNILLNVLDIEYMCTYMPFYLLIHKEKNAFRKQYNAYMFENFPTIKNMEL